jgi:hypothetical protein
MKICFNLFPPVNKLIAFLVCLLLIVIYTKLKAEKNNYEINSSSVSYKEIQTNAIKNPFKTNETDYLKMNK